MGRKQSNPVGTLYFSYDKLKNLSTCKIKNCYKPLLKGKHATNLETHIRSCHKDEWAELEREKVIPSKTQYSTPNMALKVST